MKDWEALREAIVAWADKEFGHHIHLSRVKHLEEEVDELKDAYFEYKNPDVLNLAVADELADVMILAMHIAHTHGIDLHHAVAEKFEEVKLRKWLPPDKDGVIRHVK